MRPLRVTVSLLGAVSLTMSSPATTMAASRHHVDITVTDARVIAGNPGTFAGVFSGRPLGGGGVVQRVTVTSTTQLSATTKATFTIFTTKGTLTGTGTSTRTTQPNGSVTITADRTVTGGTGAYRRAKGHLSVTGTTSQQGVSTSRWVGSVQY